MAVVRYYYGAKPDKPDDRDYGKKYHKHEIPFMWTHPNVDLSGYVHHVYDQKDLGSCTANALCAAYGLDLVKQSKTTKGGFSYFDPSRLFLYYNTREREGNRLKDSGASIREALKAMNCNGVCKESDWPYIVKRFKEKPPQSAYAAAVGNNLCKYERLDQDIDQFRACLKDNCPFVFGFNVYGSFDDTKTAGYMPLPSIREQLGEPLGKHAVVAVGYDDSKRYFKLLNSWGSRWGDNGYFYMPYQFIENSSLCFDFWKISFACERGKPRPKDTVPCTDCSTSSGIESQLDLYHPPPSSGRASDYGGYPPPSRVNSRASDYGWHPPSFTGMLSSGGAFGYGGYPPPPSHYQPTPPPSSSHSSGASGYGGYPPPSSHSSGRGRKW
ncbi:PREDICTED: uncharacterized protein LOC105312396 [Amphimedon queenslandica]|uniref:Peptidase C1A papain C-terminal domain-containing protein n=1 Tax=Amphimedon queenslandica TaxID=400682 RepID=A0A1X7V4G5_AMPQE|nr:PREDICTED: uncharacterized protein LOC105312396 [Amphimedon queenslandica]|eukprot:XP_011403307.1 PREDICTED: uncharacterized protein LOC105312396 [Amphimedon queenslandica]